MSCFVRLFVWDDEVEDEECADWRYLNIDTIVLFQDAVFSNVPKVGYTWMRVQYTSTDNALLCTKMSLYRVHKAIKKAQIRMARRMNSK